MKMLLLSADLLVSPWEVFVMQLVCTAGELNRITSKPHLQRPQDILEKVLDVDYPCAASQSLLKLFLLFVCHSHELLCSLDFLMNNRP